MNITPNAITLITQKIKRDYPMLDSEWIKDMVKTAVEYWNDRHDTAITYRELVEDAKDDIKYYLLNALGYAL